MFFFLPETVLLSSPRYYSTSRKKEITQFTEREEKWKHLLNDTTVQTQKLKKEVRCLKHTTRQLKRVQWVSLGILACLSGYCALMARQTTYSRIG